ncbi:TIGR03546 family protein [Reinekea blandensis]|uniref:DUF2062 domain-containing protein n=1 Tax=Reinekea blandensis MED297 TaxID=314283 RepID=A4BBN8_9GAMM|nr:TIGR03546 family protein [Reinekea blandensis]EAR10373.1 hypothetical protein MED297_01090 [Reinekea sp. MED297] [Reinekea blandensis MED297]
MIDSLLKLLKALNSDVGPWQISFAGALALIIGFTPLWSPHNLLILLFAFVFRVHLATFFVFWGVFSALAWLLDPWFHAIGLSLLNQDSLQGFWTGLYQSDFWQATRFNHSITLGSLLVSVLAFLPAAVIFRLGVVQYRAYMLPYIDKLKVVQLLKGSRFYQLYERIG